MAVYVRAKRVTDPLNDKVKASICGHHDVKSYVSSSGSEHDSDHHHDSSTSSCSLSDLIHGFLESDDDDKGRDKNVENDHEECSSDSEKRMIDSNNSVSLNESIGMLRDLLNPRVRFDSGFRLLLQSQVTKAITLYSSSLSSDKGVLRRRVMSYLRENGYNAGICKTKWESCGGLTGGNYEFIDVIKPASLSCSSEIRYFIDIDFIGEFEIARPTSQYEKLVQILPRVYIGRSEELKQIIKLVSEAAKKSLKINQLLLSPWRKNRFMQMKWFGPYKRTLNQVSSSSSSSASPTASNIQLGFHQKINFAPIKCQSSSSMRFNVDRNSSSIINGICNGGRLNKIPVATRIR
ncbi:hypothetical protein C5167_023802 [Papaver somniferum]|uniref:DUF506 family protein n=1 Tax=Papaver somniferum TaxID=3469 RepID=A0A4Y7JLT5_PAPSO|nr:uncharacterized protein LOC113282824 [Papaver somniferum]RZC62043.1 hypothetical protein C5167_023802 [Papaver somniferum]